MTGSAARALSSVDDVLRTLQRSEDGRDLPWEALYGRVEAAHAGGEVDFLVALLAATRPSAGQAGVWSPAAHLAGVAFRALALVPGEAAVRGLLAHCEGSREPTVLAAALAQAQPLEVLARAASATSGAAREVVAAWLHESVYHGPGPLAEPSLVAFAARLRGEGHPLGRVPLRLTALEREHRRNGPGVRPRSHGSWSILPQSAVDAPDPRPACALAASERSDPAWAARVAAIFIPPGLVCNARVEARRYVLASPVPPGLLGAPVLRALAPACLTGQIEDEEDPPAPADPAAAPVRARPAGAAELLACFLQFAIGWRCYGTYAGVGPGRARAHDGMAALCDLPADTPWDEIDAAARSHRFARFEVEGRWFDGICEDSGFMALDPSGRRVSVVAETDSD